MYKRLIYKVVMMGLVVIGLGAMSAGSATGANDAAPGTIKVSDGARPVQDKGAIMALGKDKKSFVIKEIQVVMGKFRLDGKDKVHTTRLLNEQGNEVKFEALQENQWVIVKGYQQGQFVIFAEEVKIVADQIKRDNRKIKKLKPTQ